ncbi:primosomal replication protein N [Alginatibacterium sediminis]|uniref:Replication restart protein PriB n=1 Tax=Alginatibacterium sediminis TaxID=2164068 RepID=A0A420E8Y7_9ALTE|nr:primosomal replication protein N [Alginatibacterium sediminis]RKF15798.1 primosomal replication protein N [Alginatibacterium sediminis]
MTENRVTLSGRVARAPKNSVSPAGIPHCQFWLEHRSQQLEAGFSRQAYCYMAVALSGELHKQVTQQVTMGCDVKVMGFIHQHRQVSGESRLVLHAQQIELLSRG